MKKCVLGIIGCGNMAKAILRSLSSDVFKHAMRANGIKFSVAVSDCDVNKLDEVREYVSETFTDNAELVSCSDYIISAVKPQTAESVLKDLDFENKVFISIMAGITIRRLKSFTGNTTDKIVRVMPNLNAKVGYSVNCYCVDGLSDEEEKNVEYILGSFGEYYKIRESMMNSVTGLCGSGPAFVFMFADAFVKKGIECGFSADAARELAFATILGSMENIRAFDGEISSLAESVCSKAGTTIEGVNYLKEMNFEDTVKEAIDRAVKRSEALEKSI